MRGDLKLLCVTLALASVSMSYEVSHAQQKSGKMDMTDFKKKSKAFYDRKIGEMFAPIEEWKCMNGDYFDLNKAQGPAVIYLGFYGCAPCRQAMPLYAQLSLEKKYNGYNFVYLTFDDSATINEELSKAKIAEHKMRLVSLPETYMRAKGMALGFPVIYFLDNEKTVKMIYAYGELNGQIDSLQYWHSLLDALK